MLSLLIIAAQSKVGSICLRGDGEGLGDLHWGKTGLSLTIGSLAAIPAQLKARLGSSS